MTIKNVQVDHFMIPLPTVLSDSTHGIMTHFGLVTVRITDEDGNEGLGYTYTVNAGSRACAVLIEEDIVPMLLNKDADCIENLWQKVWWHLHFVGRGGLASFAIAAVDVALWDLKARKVKSPLWKLMGGNNPRVKAYAGGIDLQMPIDQLLQQTEDNLAKGLKAIKMKVGREKLSEDVDRVRAVRELIGDDITFMVDANMVWSVDHAIQAARKFADFNIHWLEEPTNPDDITGYARIQREGGVAIAAGENFHNLEEFRHLISAEGVTFVEPDVGTCGGVTPWLKIARLAESYNLKVTSHGVHDLNIQLLAAVPNATYLEIHGFGLERFLKDPLTFDDGFATAPNRPGHGVELDFERLEQYRTKI
ncbi:mandelate racemase/muconate lactonizing enzyme family protein [Rhodobacteraceae bacterium RKSG542]|uniref:mandelate racemase/muconate lactonizing enzyme family protein n=1 Tax=Pseudovibrio flavus TaxID=2529854 RepID=UPI0012BC1DEA|nr:mandelate racemase/muconate lactonizing enzyme family protein [Pseudovibrio flavus]MTI15973.1 mandelate racemase/muconate lactonizing enzyme family protein [Pseudovibrio flavus]